MYQKWKEKIENLALEVLQKNNLLNLPIDVEKVANSIGLKIISHDLEDEISGVLVIDKGIGSIGINSRHALVRKRFTVAHEIGHFLLHQKDNEVFVDKSNKHMVMFRDGKSSTGEFQQEREANAFAAALLMPKELLSKQVNKYTFNLDGDEIEGDSTISRLSNEFKVSSAAMAFRLSNLGYLAM